MEITTVQQNGKNVFIASSTYAEKDLLKSAGFRWNPNSKKWGTDNINKVATLVQYCNEAVRALLTSTLGMKNLPEKVEHKEVYIPTKKEVAEVLKKLRFMSDRCDGANSLDGEGFNGRDTGICKDFARCDHLTPKQYACAVRRLKKYSRQLDLMEME